MNAVNGTQLRPLRSLARACKTLKGSDAWLAKPKTSLRQKHRDGETETKKAERLYQSLQHKTKNT